MNIINELSQRNTYIPDLSNSQESCERTYKEAESFFEMVEIYLEKLEKEIDSLTEKDIYDKCNPIATNLALCCELFLKAIYIYEHSLSGDKIDEIWDTLSRQKDRKVYDEHNNPIYHINGTIVRTRYDEGGNPILDEKGNRTYIDANGNILKQGAQGEKLQVTGHNLEYIITSVISPESRLLLEIMMTANSISETTNHKKVDLLDILASRKAISLTKKISEVQYNSWLSQHKETFVDARYAGQKQPNVEISFLYHLATQCKALALYVIEPDKKENVNLTAEEMEKIPNVISKLAEINKRLVTYDLIKLVIHDDNKRKKLEGINQPGIIELFFTSKPSHFYSLISDFEIDEIAFICESMSKCSRKKQSIGNINDSFELLLCLIKPKEFLEICIYLKTLTKYKINNELMVLLIEKLLSKTIMESNYNGKITYNKFDYDIPKDLNIINKKHIF